MKQTTFILLLCILIPTFTIGLPQFTSRSNPSFRIIKVNEIIAAKSTTNSDLELLLLNEYHNLSMVYKELERFNSTAPEIIDYSFIGESYYNNSIPLITLTNEKTPLESKGKTYIVAHHHAREQFTIEHVLRLIRDYINDYGEDETITSILDDYIVYIIVTLNPDSLDHTLYEDEFHRKNMRPVDEDGDGLFDEDGWEDINKDGRISEWVYAKYVDGSWTYDYEYEGIDNDGDGLFNEDRKGGVDLNRNYPIHWNDSSADSGSALDKSSFTYCGSEPFSEPETKALRDFVEKHNFTHASSLHTGTNASLLDWSYTTDIHQPERPIYDEMMNDMYTKRLLPSSFFLEENELDYTSGGTWDDWTYITQNTIPMTLEMYHMNGSEYYHYPGEPDNDDFQWNGSHWIGEFDTMFEYFSPPADQIENLHKEYIEFEKFWLSLTPKITLEDRSFKEISSTEFQIKLQLNSGSRYFNTSDDAKVTVTSENDNLTLSYLSNLGVIQPNVNTELTITVNGPLTKNSNISIDITSEWASDLHYEVFNDDKETPTQVNGFEIVFIIIGLVLVTPKRRKA